mgnify:CR=1 FL=1
MVISIAGLALILGLAAWGLGFAALPLHRKKDAARLCGMGSLTCCAASLCTVVFELARYADIEDISAFLDTANAFRLCSGVLLAGTLVLNALALVFRFRKQRAV